jgi:HK97 family phage prohead protease
MNNESKNIDIELKDDSGQVEAVFSIFNSLDSDGDVVMPGAVKSGFKNNQVPMVWSHKWDMPIGKGTINQDNDKAVFKGEFFMDTESGKEAYNLVKNMGDMQQWSFGYKVNDSEFAKADGQDSDARYLKDLTVYEVSPVLVGANQDTYTLAIKSNTELLKEIAGPEEGTEDECCGNCEGEEKAAVGKDMYDNPGEAMEASKDMSCAIGVHTHKDKNGKNVFMPCKTHEEYEKAIGKGYDDDDDDDKKGYGDDEDEMKSCKYHDGGRCMKEYDEDNKKSSNEVLEDSQEDSKSFSEEVIDVLAALDDLVARAKAIAMLRGEDGRKLGVKATEALRAVADDLNDAWTEIDEFIGNVGTEGALELEVEEELVEDEPAETEEVAEASTDTIDVETEVEEVTEEEAPAEEPVVEEPEDEAAEEETPEDNTDSSDEEFDAEWIRAQQIIAESLVEEIEEV